MYQYVYDAQDEMVEMLIALIAESINEIIR